MSVTSPYGSPTGGGWYNSGSTATFGVTTPLSGGTGTQYVLGSWSGLGAGSYSGSASSYSVTMSNAIVEAAGWTTQYYFTVNNGGYGTATGSGWYNSGTSAQAVILSNVVAGGAGTQYVFAAWTGNASGTGLASNSIIMNSPNTAIATWTTQYQLTFEVTPSGSGSTTPTGNNLWVNSGPLSISVVPNSGYSFSQWTNSGAITFSNSNSQSTTANVNGPSLITASMTLSPIPSSSPAPTPTQIPSPSPTTAPPSAPNPTQGPTDTTTPTAAPSSTPSPTNTQTNTLTNTPTTTATAAPGIPQGAIYGIVTVVAIVGIFAVVLTLNIVGKSKTKKR